MAVQWLVNDMFLSIHTTCLPPSPPLILYKWCVYLRSNRLHDLGCLVTSVSLVTYKNMRMRIKIKRRVKGTRTRRKILKT